MKQIQSMPDIWDSKSFWTTRSTIIGAFVQAAVRQSPYVCPINIDVGIREFNGALISDGGFVTNFRDLRSLVRETIEKCPTVQSWNVPKEGEHTTVFVSRYSQLQPDYDFIDLGAMARNIAQSVTLEEKYNQLHDCTSR